MVRSGLGLKTCVKVDTALASALLLTVPWQCFCHHFHCYLPLLSSFCHHLQLIAAIISNCYCKCQCCCHLVLLAALQCSMPLPLLLAGASTIIIVASCCLLLFDLWIFACFCHCCAVANVAPAAAIATSAATAEFLMPLLLGCFIFLCHHVAMVDYWIFFVSVADTEHLPMLLPLCLLTASLIVHVGFSFIHCFYYCSCHQPVDCYLLNIIQYAVLVTCHCWLFFCMHTPMLEFLWLLL